MEARALLSSCSARLADVLSERAALRGRGGAARLWRPRAAVAAVQLEARGGRLAVLVLVRGRVLRNGWGEGGKAEAGKQQQQQWP